MRIGYVMDAGVPDIRPPAASGPARHVRAVCGALAALGHDVRIVARFEDGIHASRDLATFAPIRLRGVDDGAWRLVERVVRRTQRQCRLPYVAAFDAHRFAAACCEVLDGVDVVYERFGWMGLGGRLAARRLGVPHVIEVNGDHLHELAVQGMTPGPLQRRVSVWRMRRVARGAAWTIATGAGWRDRHAARWGVDPAAVAVVPNGTGMIERLPREALRAFAAPGAGASGPLRLIFAGAFDPWQGLPLILRGVARAGRAGADVTLVLAGGGREAATVQRDVEALGLGRRVTFAGHLGPDALARALAAADVGVAAYGGRGEYSGLKLLDYKAAGLAVVTTGAGGRPEEIEDGRHGLLVPEGDEAAFAAAISRLAADRALVRRLGAAGRLDAEARHRWIHTAQRLVRGLESVLAAAPARQISGAPVRDPGVFTRQG